MVKGAFTTVVNQLGQSHTFHMFEPVSKYANVLLLECNNKLWVFSLTVDSYIFGRVLQERETCTEMGKTF